MKYFLFLLVFFFFPVHSFCQKIRFTNPTNFWHVKEIYTLGSGSTDYYYDYWYGLDTIIGSVTYKKMLCSDSSRAYVREDTILGIVYYNKGIIGLDDTLYNYNLQLNGKLSYNSASIYILDRIIKFDSVLINGVYHKRYDFECTNCNQYQYYRFYTVIEGVGCMSGPLFPLSSGACTGGSSTWNYDLVCFSQNNIAPLFSVPSMNDCYGTSTFTNTGSCLPAWAKPTISLTNLLNIYPNPAKRDLSIRWQTLNDTNLENEIVHLQIINALGQIAYAEEVKKQYGLMQTNIHIYITQGLYFMQLTDEKGNSEIRKIIVE